MIKKLLILTILSVSSVCAQDPGQIISGPKLNAARMAHEQIALPNGNILLLGGHGTGFTSLASAEIYDPVQNTFSFLSTSYIHDWGAFTALSNGTYFIAGGATDLGVAPGTNGMEIYDPANQSTPFSALAKSMLYYRNSCTAAELSSGDILIAGDWYYPEGAQYGEVYRPSDQSQKVTGALVVPRANPILVPVKDGGAVLFSGNYTYGSATYESIEYYNATTNSFELVRNYILPGDSGWIPLNFRLSGSTNITKEGNYCFLASRSFGDTSGYKIFTVNPDDREFHDLTKDNPIKLPMSYIIYGPVIDTAKQTAYFLTQRRYSNADIGISSFDLRTNTFREAITFTQMPDNYYLSSVRMSLLKSGKLLLTGGHSQTGYNTNFSPVDLSFIINPEQLTAVDDHITSANTFRLSAAYPNPFNPSTSIDFSIPSPARVTLKVFDILGREVAVLIDGEMDAGNHTARFNASGLSSGVYIYRLNADTYSASNKFILQK